MRKITHLLIFVLGLGALNSCNTEFSLNGDYEIQPIVFGLLDHTKDVHIIKITKAYLGDGDNLVYAQNPDSNYFQSVAGTVTEFINGDATGRSWSLTDSIITTKSTDGAFYAPEQKVYVFYESNLDSTATYELKLDLNNGAHEVTGSTELISKFRVSSQLYFPNFTIPFAPNTVSEDDDYSTWKFNVDEGNNGKRYNYKYSIRWTEYYQDNTQASFSATREEGDIFQEKPGSPGLQTANFSGLDFYNWVGQVVPVDPKVVNRKLDGLDLRVSVAHYEFSQYLDVGAPVTGIAQVQPEFTNLTGSRGLFSSRIVLDVPGLKLNPSSLEHLCTGANGKVAGRAFCSSYPEHMGELWYCP